MLSDLATRVNENLSSNLAGRGCDAAGQLQEIIHLAAYPDQVYQGANTDTCAPSSSMTILANQNPAELARLATGLVFDGHVNLPYASPPHNTMSLSTTALNTLDRGRGSTNELLQQSILDYGASLPSGNGATAAGGR